MSAALARLRTALRYSSGRARAESLGLIAELEAQNDCPGSDTAGAAAPQNLVPAVRSDSRSGPEGGSVHARQPQACEPPQTGPAPQADAGEVTAGRDRQPHPQRAAVGGSSETNARQSGGCGSAVPLSPVAVNTANPVTHGDAAGSAAPLAPPAPPAAPGERICQHCRRAFRPNWARQRYCGPPCQQQRQRHYGAARPCAGCGAAFYPNNNRQTLCPACRQAAKTAPPAAAAPPADTRQQPRRPSFKLGWDARIVIGPVRPAPLRRDATGAALPYQDDLNAIADHGSSAAELRGPVFGQAQQSPLANVT